MSTNVYRMREVIEYGDVTGEYHGWAISWTGDFQQVCPFDSRDELEAFQQFVAAQLPAPVGADAYYAQLVAALLAVECMGDEYQREGNALGATLDGCDWATDELLGDLRESAYTWRDK